MINYLKNLAKKAISWTGWEANREGFSSLYSANIHADRAKYSTEIGDPLRTSLVMAAVKWLGRTIHEAPLLVIQRNRIGREINKLAKHPVLSLIKRPNPFYSGKILMKGLAASWILNGNAYILKRRNKNLLIEELWYEPHITIRPRFPGDRLISNNSVSQWPITGQQYPWILFYEIYRHGNWDTKISVEDVIHFKDGMDPSNPRLGINGISALLAEIYTDQQRAHFSATVLSNIGMIPFVVSPRESNSRIREEEALLLKEKLDLAARGDRGKPIVAGRAIRIDELGFSPQDMDLQALAAIPEERIASVLGPNAYILGFIPERNVFSSYAEAREDAYESYLVPLHKYLAEELTDNILAEFMDLDSDLTSTALEYDFSSVTALQDHRDRIFMRWGRAFRDGIATRYTALQETGQEANLETDNLFVQDLGPLPGTKITDYGNDNERPLPGRDDGPVLGGQRYGPGI